MQVKVVKKNIYKVCNGDTLDTICNLFKIDGDELLMINNIKEIKENQTLYLPNSYSHIYVVKPLDTYQKIAQKLGVNIQTVVDATNGKKMFIGQKIFIK